jgi:hypothetical protein
VLDGSCTLRYARPDFEQRWPLERPLTTLSIISAQRASGRNSVSLSLAWCSAEICRQRFRIGDAVVVDPAISSGLPLPTVNRQPPPGSRPEKYSTPATKGLQNLFVALSFVVDGHFNPTQHPTRRRTRTGNGTSAALTPNSPSSPSPSFPPS